MRISTLISSAFAIAFAGCAVAAGPENPYSAYQKELNRDEFKLNNSSFDMNVARSEMKRDMKREMRNAEGKDLDIRVTQDSNSRRGRTTRGAGGVSIGSPNVFGDVKGDVNIFIDRNAIGNVYSLRR